MSPEVEKDTIMTRNQQLAWGAATICFLIGWYHTGHGLMNYRVLGTEYGGFVLALGLLAIMVIAYRKAIMGSPAGLLFYVLCAVVTFLCNLNSFYPNYRSNSLIREELRQHRTSLVDLRESIKNTFKDVRLEALATSVRSKSGQLQAQCKQGGFGTLAEDKLGEIEAELGRPITRLRLGKNQADWDNCAAQYAAIVESELEAKLGENRQADKQADINHATDLYDLFSSKIDKTLVDKTELRRVPDYVEDLIKGYRDACKKAKALVADERGNKATSTDEKEQSLQCHETYSSPNVELGTFSHTFKSAWSTKSDGGTIAVVTIAFFLDFILPLALYFLVRTDKRGSRDDDFWTTGGKIIGPTVRS